MSISLNLKHELSVAAIVQGIAAQKKDVQYIHGSPPCVNPCPSRQTSQTPIHYAAPAVQPVRRIPSAKVRESMQLFADKVRSKLSHVSTAE